MLNIFLRSLSDFVAILLYGIHHFQDFDLLIYFL